MKWYCKICKKIHDDEELCLNIKSQLKEDPQLLVSALDFINVAGQDALISTQALDTVAQGVNKLTGTNLAYEGTKQFARDIQVFQRLNTEVFSRSKHFSSANKAMNYYENVKIISETKEKAMHAFEAKLTGYSQEVDWLKMKQGQISSLWERSSLLGNNAPGVDGTTVSRFTGKTISRTTIKASKNAVNRNNTGVKGVEKAISKGTASEKDIIFATKGTREAAKKAGLDNKVKEYNTAESVKKSNERLKSKIADGQATTYVTMDQLKKKMVQGAVVGAAIGITISSITSYVKYRNGEISKEDVFKEISQDTLKGAITGAGMGAVTIFIPGGAIGFLGGVAIGIYFNSTVTNVLDEIYGKGAFGAILDSTGYVYGMTLNLSNYYEKIKVNDRQTKSNIKEAQLIQNEIEKNFDIFDKMKGE